MGWLEAEPAQVAVEKASMAEIAPELNWIEDELTGGWRGVVPIWPFERPMPRGLEAFLAGRRLTVEVQYLQAHPMVEPKVWPLDPQPDPMHRSRHDWHVNGDGSLCMLQTASDWDGTGTAADLIVKAAGWFIEYLLMEGALIEKMTINGIAVDDSLDHLLVSEQEAEPVDP